MRPGEPATPRVECLELINSDIRYVKTELLKAELILNTSKRFLQESYSAKGPIKATVKNVTILGEPLRRHNTTPHFTRYQINVSVGIQGDVSRRGTAEVSIMDSAGKRHGYGTVEFRAGENNVDCNVTVELYQNEELFAVTRIFDQGIKGPPPGKSDKFKLIY